MPAPAATHRDDPAPARSPRQRTPRMLGHGDLRAESKGLEVSPVEYRIVADGIEIRDICKVDASAHHIAQ